MAKQYTAKIPFSRVVKMGIICNQTKRATLSTIYKELQTKYPNKEIIMSETGVQDYWEALAKPENFTWQSPTLTNGKSQDIYLYGLLETCIEIDAVCWWYNFAHKDGLTSKRLQQYLGGAID